MSSCPASERLGKSLQEAPDSEVNLRVSPEHRGQSRPLQVTGGNPHGRGKGRGRARASALRMASRAVRLSITRMQQRIQLAPTTNLLEGQTERHVGHRGRRPRAAPGAPRAGPRAGARQLMQHYRRVTAANCPTGCPEGRHALPRAPATVKTSHQIGKLPGGEEGTSGSGDGPTGRTAMDQTQALQASP